MNNESYTQPPDSIPGAPSSSTGQNPGGGLRPDVEDGSISISIARSKQQFRKQQQKHGQP